MILSFIFFLILFLGGIWVMALAQSLEDFQAIVFIAGLLIVSLSLAFVMRASGSATRRKDNWSGSPICAPTFSAIRFASRRSPVGIRSNASSTGWPGGRTYTV